jgi:hypothetical protein
MGPEENLTEVRRQSGRARIPTNMNSTLPYQPIMLDIERCRISSKPLRMLCTSNWSTNKIT